MTASLAPLRGGTVFGDAIRVCALDVNGAPVSGASSMIQSDNLVKVDYSWDWQAGVDVSQVNAQGNICLSYKGRDTTKRINATVQICDEDVLLENLLVGGTIFTNTPTRTSSVTTTSSSPNLTGTFTSADVGATITGTGIPSGTPTTIISQTGTAAVMSANATASASITATITGVTAVDGYQPPKVGVVSNPYGCSVEVWSKRIVRDVQVGWKHFAFPRLFLSVNDQVLGDAFSDMSFKGFGNENANWGSGPKADFLHDSTACVQWMPAAALPSPLQDGYQTIP